MTLRRALRLLLLSLAAAALVGILAGSSNRLRAQNPAKSAPAKATAQTGGTTNEDCATCHEDVVKAFAKNPHTVLEKSPHYNMKNSCESCHGPGEEHVSSGGDITKILSFKGQNKAEYNKNCLNCHKNNHEIQGFAATPHAKTGMSCSDCHRVHTPASMTKLLKQPTNTLCFTCHVTQRTEFSKPHHHRVIEKAMTCVDCHQPHSGIEHRMARMSSFGEESCLKCHSDKQGPFVFEHAPTVIRSCQSCHQPHGSNNPKMLVRPVVQQMCLECHAGSVGIPGNLPPSFHNVRSPRYQNCTTCHVKIHGSNVSSTFIR
jgi:DmsE family decaheme c-type cytochrome